MFSENPCDRCGASYFNLHSDRFVKEESCITCGATRYQKTLREIEEEEGSEAEKEVLEQLYERYPFLRPPK